MKEILPKELAKYFFFDGERIGNMSKEIRKGKSKEFAEAAKKIDMSNITEYDSGLNEKFQQALNELYAEGKIDWCRTLNDTAFTIRNL